MGKPRLSHQQRIARLVARMAEGFSPGRVTRSKLRVILHDCGWKKRGSENLARIQAAFEEAGIYLEPMLTAPGLDWEQMIYFSHEKPDPYLRDWYAPQHAFGSEKALQRFLMVNFSQIKDFRKLKQPIAEYQLPSGRRIDILCRERRSSAFVVIELKKHDVDPVDQLNRYLREVDLKLAHRGNKQHAVKGMIVTGEPNSALERSLEERIPD